MTDLSPFIPQTQQPLVLQPSVIPNIQNNPTNTENITYNQSKHQTLNSNESQTPWIEIIITLSIVLVVSIILHIVTWTVKNQSVFFLFSTLPVRQKKKQKKTKNQKQTIDYKEIKTTIQELFK